MKLETTITKLEVVGYKSIDKEACFRMTVRGYIPQNELQKLIDHFGGKAQMDFEENLAIPTWGHNVKIFLEKEETK